MLRKYLPAAIFIILLLIITEIGIYFSLNNPRKNLANDTNALLSKCLNQTQWEKCYGEQFQSLTKSEGVKYAIEVKQKVSQKDERTWSCHLIAHYIALANVNQDPKHALDIFKYVNLTDCAYGYIHGTVEGLSRFDQSYIVTAKTAPKICQQIASANNSESDDGCFHAMGHVILSNFCNPNVPKAVDKALSSCSTLSINQKKQCYEGVFMESFTRDDLNTHCATPYVDWFNSKKVAEDQEKLCGNYTGEKATSCWQEISHIYQAQAKHNPEQVYNDCLKSGKLSDAAVCYNHQVSLLYSTPNLVGKYKGATICDMFSDNPQYMGLCYNATVVGLLYTSLNYFPQAKSLCTNIKNEYQKGCFESMITFLRSINHGQVSNLCSKLPANYKSECLSKN